MFNNKRRRVNKCDFKAMTSNRISCRFCFACGFMQVWATLVHPVSDWTPWRSSYRHTQRESVRRGSVFASQANIWNTLLLKMWLWQTLFCAISLSAGNNIYYDLFLTKLTYRLLRAIFNRVNSSLQICHYPKMHLLVYQYQLLTFSQISWLRGYFFAEESGQAAFLIPTPLGG